MVPYFVRHSYKVFIWGNQNILDTKIGFYGYPVKVTPYQSKSINSYQDQLAFGIVKRSSWGC